MNFEHKDKMKNQPTNKGAGYSANNVSVIKDIFHQQLEHFVNHMPIYQKYKISGIRHKHSS